MAIHFQEVSHFYSKGSKFETEALKKISLSIAEHKMTAIIGHTGSGKSTLVQHLNALLLPDEGQIEIVNRTIVAGDKNKGLKSLRKEVGLVFQFPEYQLFEETVLKDVSFGPKNFGMSVEEAIEKAKLALKAVGISENLYERSPLELSGGQKRRVAIAGILAMEPKILVLDEPTAGLDPQGAKQMMTLFSQLQKERDLTVILVSHDMDQVLQYCEDVVVLQEGKLAFQGNAWDFFHEPALLEQLHVLAPSFIRFQQAMIQKGFPLEELFQTKEEFFSWIESQVAHV
ncbi:MULTISPECIES: energy-coupling factor transporter ATPase [Terrabacteria group]|uniref:energy-coupling factor transporter ATPase n=1 Tax=Bacillati TaxID=1783272 RepID=UPI00193A41A9|nr:MULTISPECIES: energy-coupling factor transporter ATPase [Terrabacteria group]MBW9212641.1 energy-coupling factor transporter ATPase [Trueperella sp. zg.1013]QRG86871.1 energy-coupling factor transporter ATPase [Bulleidia sp. zg-1006]